MNEGVQQDGRQWSDDHRSRPEAYGRDVPSRQRDAPRDPRRRPDLHALDGSHGYEAELDREYGGWLDGLPVDGDVGRGGAGSRGRGGSNWRGQDHGIVEREAELVRRALHRCLRQPWRQLADGDLAVHAPARLSLRTWCGESAGLIVAPGQRTARTRRAVL